jgi:hypothetical protein
MFCFDRMTEPHVIRLRGPWELTPLVRLTPVDRRPESSASRLPSGGKTPVPGDWSGHLGDAFYGTVRYLRRFNSPTHLDLGERVWLVCEAIDPRGTATLNEQPIFAAQNPAGPCAQDITDLLRARNRLAIDIELTPEDDRPEALRRADRRGRAGGLPGEVRLEIRREG